MNFPLFCSTFVLIFLAELPDKTAFATLLLATRGHARAVFTGVATAFFIQTVVAIAFGGLIAQAPRFWVHLATGVLFVGFAAQMCAHVMTNQNQQKPMILRVLPILHFGAWLEMHSS